MQTFENFLLQKLLNRILRYCTQIVLDYVEVCSTGGNCNANLILQKCSTELL